MVELRKDKDGALMSRDHCRTCRKPVGPFHRYNPLAIDEDDGWIFCDACQALEDQARREYRFSLSWWERFLEWWRDGR